MEPSSTPKNGETGQRQGQLEWVQLNEGSKSERRGPVLVDEEGQQTQVYVVGDNPFENESLKALEGHILSLEGIWRNGVLRVTPENLRLAISVESHE